MRHFFPQTMSTIAAVFNCHFNDKMVVRHVLWAVTFCNLSSPSCYSYCVLSQQHPCFSISSPDVLRRHDVYISDMFLIKLSSIVVCVCVQKPTTNIALHYTRHLNNAYFQSLFLRQTYDLPHYEVHVTI